MQAGIPVNEPQPTASSYTVKAGIPSTIWYTVHKQVYRAQTAIPGTSRYTVHKQVYQLINHDQLEAGIP